MELIEANVPFLTSLFEVLLRNEGILCLHQCPLVWSKFLRCIGSGSPVCALVPPKDEALELMDKMSDKDISMEPEV